MADQTSSRRRVAILGSPDARLGADEVLPRLELWLKRQADVIFAGLGTDAAPIIEQHPDLIFVLGGDGTLISVVHGLGLRQAPIVGVNLGKLGFLADFTIEQLETNGAFLFGERFPLTRRIMLDVQVRRADGENFRAPAVNDCVIHAGAPFRMIEIAVHADDHEVSRMMADGLIIATPSGSTAHNLSAGGPILEPTARSVILTPICPHALTFRPLTMSVDRRLVVTVPRANEGTTAVIDGRIARPFGAGDTIVLTRFAADFLLVHNPRHSEWHALRNKLRWGQLPLARR